MNNTKSLTAIVAILVSATLVVGTFATVAATQPAFAAPQKKPGHDDKKDKTRDNGSGSRNGNTITALKCQNTGSASGFDTAVGQECENLICTHPGNNATCSQEGVVVTPTPIPTPVNKTCEQCLTSLLTPEQLTIFLREFGVNLSLADFCTIVLRQGVGGFELTASLDVALVSQPIQDKLFQCLINAGVHIS